MRYALFYLARPIYGGWVSFTAHLVTLLQRAGHEVTLHKIGSRTEGRLRHLVAPVEYQNVDPVAAVAIAAGAHRALIVACDKSGIEHAHKLAAVGARLVIHDPTELKMGVQEAARRHRPVIIRRANAPAVQQATGREPVLLQHPYARRFEQRSADHANPGHHRGAVAISRVDWDKRTDMIAEAALEHGADVQIYGAVNRMYAHHKLPAGWERLSRGTFARTLHAGAEVASGFARVVDLSAIAGDGGGTQYTFLEAWDAGAELVVNRAWTAVPGTVAAGVTCRAVGSARELAEVLATAPDPAIVARGRGALEQHGTGCLAALDEVFE